MHLDMEKTVLKGQYSWWSQERSRVLFNYKIVQVDSLSPFRRALATNNFAVKS